MVLKAKTATGAAPAADETNPNTPAPLNNDGALTEPGNPAASIAELNPFLQGLEGVGEGDGKSRISVDGSEFHYKKLDLRVSELVVPGNVITGGNKLYQWWPAKDKEGNQTEDGQMCMSYDHKTSVDGIPCISCAHFKDKSCKMKYELAFTEYDETESTDVEHTLTMSTTSAIAFIDYVRALAAGQVASPKDTEWLKKPLDARKPNGPNNWYVDKVDGEFRLGEGRRAGLNEVVTRVIVQRVTKDIKGQKVTWGQAVFQAVGFVEGITA